MDVSGRPSVGAAVRQYWQNYSVENREHYQYFRTDQNGRAAVPQRQTSASLAFRIVGCLGSVAKAGVHATCGDRFHVVVWDGRGTGGLDDSTPIPTQGDIVVKLWR
jgi:hypothetical protein